MKAMTILTLLILLLAATTVSAEFLEIEASEIVTIEPAAKTEPARVLVKWSLPAMLGEKIVDAAAIEMPVALSAGDKVPIEVAPVTTSWEATEVNWTSDWSNAGGDFDADNTSHAIVTASNDQLIRADVYFAVSEQIAGQLDNFGFIVVPTGDAEATVTNITANDKTELEKAKLIIAYRNKR